MEAEGAGRLGECGEVGSFAGIAAASGQFVANNIHTPSTLTDAVRRTLEARLPFVWVRGEISNFSRAASGHIYFSLKDSRSQVQCVWFAGRQSAGGEKFDPLTGEVFETPRPSLADMLANGMEALCAGAINVYAPRGQYQLNVELVQPAGTGVLAMEFEARKARLAQAGYFAPERKRPLPPSPLRVALVASPAGAAVHDFLTLAAERGLAATIRLYPAPAQGADAARRMAEAIALANGQNWAQVIALVRGGGSLEDLWAFNEEELASAIFNSRLPVVAGVGHEVDVTLADMTADVRAATPSHAAQILWPPRRELWQRLDNLQLGLDRLMARIMESAESRCARLGQALEWLSPARRVERLEARCGAAAERLWRVGEMWLDGKERRLALAGLSAVPLEGALARLRRDVDHMAASMLKSFSFSLDRRVSALEKGEVALAQLDPAAPLKRGYALLAANGHILRSIDEIGARRRIIAILEDGAVEMIPGEKLVMPAGNGENILEFLRGGIAGNEIYEKK